MVEKIATKAVAESMVKREKQSCILCWAYLMQMLGVYMFSPKIQGPDEARVTICWKVCAKKK